MHRALAEPGYKTDSQHVKVPLQEPVKSVLGNPVLAGTVLNHLFANVPESCLTRQHGDIPVHLSIDLNAFHHFSVIGLEPAVEVVQPDPGEFPCRVVVEL